MSDEPFGRQPRPVTVTVTGDNEDVIYWTRELARRASFKDDNVDFHGRANSFTIYPRAVND